MPASYTWIANRKPSKADANADGMVLYADANKTSVHLAHWESVEVSNQYLHAWCRLPDDPFPMGPDYALAVKLIAMMTRSEFLQKVPDDVTAQLYKHVAVAFSHHCKDTSEYQIFADIMEDFELKKVVAEARSIRKTGEKNDGS